MTKAFKIKSNVATILSDYHDSHEELFKGMEIEKFDPKEFLGEEFVPFEKLKKEETKILKELC